MHFNQGRFKQTMALLLCGLGTQAAFASTTADTQSNHTSSMLSKLIAQRPKLELQLGGFDATQGNVQNIQIQGLIGDHFSVNHQSAANVLVGAGVYFDGPSLNQYSLSYGINAFYFPNTTVRGSITQEQLFTNLSYSYTLSNVPVYLAGKARINNVYGSRYNITFNGGIGPNFIRSSNVNERSLDGGVTIPDYAFAGKTATTFSATLGVGIEFNNVFGKVPVECGYRFFYLGQSNFNTRSNQLLNTLNTGNNYANAVTCSVTV
jgi:hypothetical protein